MEPKKKKEAKAETEEEKQRIKGFLSSIGFNRRHEEKRTSYYKKQDEGFKDLEKQVREIGNIFEKGKELKKAGFFSRIFRRK